MRPLTEDELWEYALDLLDPTEQDLILARIACDPAAYEELKRIRQSIEATDAAMHAPAVAALELAGEKARRAFAAIGRELDSAAAVIVRLADGLAAVFRRAAQRPGKPALEPVMLGGDEPEKETSPARARERIDIAGSEGLSAAILFVSSDRVDVRVFTEAALAGQQVELFELSPGDDAREQARLLDTAEIELTGPEAGEQRGTATFEECSFGVLKIVAPGGAEIVFFI